MKKLAPTPGKIDTAKSNRFRRDYDNHAQGCTVFGAALRPRPNEFSSAEQAWKSAKAELAALAIRVTANLPPTLAAPLISAKGAATAPEFHSAWFITPIGRDVMDALRALRCVTTAIADQDDNLAGAWLFTLGRHLERIRVQLETHKPPKRAADHTYLKGRTLLAYIEAWIEDPTGTEPTADSVLAALSNDGVKRIERPQTKVEKDHARKRALERGLPAPETHRVQTNKLGWTEPDGTKKEMSIGTWRNCLTGWRKELHQLLRDFGRDYAEKNQFTLGPSVKRKG